MEESKTEETTRQGSLIVATVYGVVMGALFIGGGAMWMIEAWKRRGGRGIG